ncbi:MAG TPA: hypothetical protein VG711_13005, partial [Phycisphaerales bacterium]|nr:hypothetical protein [Phycisphaerales bacterium]
DLELRMYAGNNYAWIASRFENAVQQTSGGPPNAACFLRGYFGGHEENSELLEQIVNRMQVLDQRHRLTRYSGARNDLMAPWLWLRRDWYDDNPNDSIDPENSPTSPDLPAYYPFDGNTAYSNWDRQYLRRLKIDLRKSVPGTAQPNTKGADYNHDGVVDAQDRLYLRDVLFRCLVDHYNYDPADPPKQSYFGDATNATVLQTTQDAAAAMAANIIAYSDNDDANSAVEITANDILPATAGVTIDDVAPVVDPVAAPAGIFSPVTTESDNQYAFLGVEPQPFLVEAFIGHVYTPNVAPAQDAEGDPYSNAGHNVILDDTSKQATVLVIQIANPFEKTIDLREYALKIGSVTVPLSSPSIVPEFAGSDFPYLRQARDNAPTTAIFYAIPPTLDASNGFDTKWKDFLDIDTQTDLAPYTFVGNMTGVSALLTKRAIYDDINSGQPIELLRMYQGGAVPVVVDRFDIEQPANNDFADAIQELDDNRPEPIPPTLPDASPTGTTPYPGIDIGLPALGYNQWVQYVRVTRAWGVDTTYPAPPVANQYFYPYRDRNPRYVFGDRAVVMAAPSAINTAVGDPDVDGPSYIAGGQRYKFGSSPETGGQNGLPWFTRDYVMLNGELASTYFTQQVANRFDLKPTFFDLRWVDNNPDTTATDRAPLPNKGWYSQSPGTAGHAGSVDDAVTNIRLNFPMQMLQKDKDFDQVGELANVWMFGHKLQFGGGAYLATKETFSEYMADPKLTGDDLYANRLRPSPNTGADAVGQVIGTPTNTANPADPTDVAHLIPDLPAGLRVYDAFVCDGRGMGVNNINNPVAQFYNANNFEQRITPGLINICTAPVEVLRALPHFYRMIWNRNDVALNDANPRTLVAEALVQYREKFNGAQVATTVPPRVSTGYEYGPDYSARTGAMGIQSIGQLLGIRSPAALQTTGPSGFTWFTKLWRSDAASLDPLQLTNAGVVSGGSYISTDVVGGNNRIKNVSNNMISHEDPALLPLDSYTVTAGEIEHTEVGDAVSGDSEEANLLFSGVSNLITTRSDVFVVYFKIRSFREDNSVSPPVWDATKLENIVEDSRYVMLVDRSNVNHPGDKPKILYLEKLPN